MVYISMARNRGNDLNQHILFLCAHTVHILHQESEAEAEEERVPCRRDRRVNNIGPFANETKHIITTI